MFNTTQEACKLIYLVHEDHTSILSVNIMLALYTTIFTSLLPSIPHRMYSSFFGSIVKAL